MIIVTAEDVVLDSSELAELATFLRTRAGQRAIKALAALRPPITGDAFSSGEASGYEKAIVNLLDMTRVIVEPKEDETTNYPDLDNDAAWVDGMPSNPPSAETE